MTIENGNIEAAVSGECKLPVGQLLKEAWRKVHDFKATFWLAMLLQVIILTVLLSLSIPLSHLFKLGGERALFFGNAAINIIFNMVQVTLEIGLIMLAVRRVSDLAIKSRMVVRYFNGAYLTSLFGLIFLMSLISFLIMTLDNKFSHLSYVWLLVFAIVHFVVILVLFYAAILVVDYGLEASTAIKQAAKVLFKKSPKLILVYLIMILVVLISVFPVVVGLMGFAILNYLKHSHELDVSMHSSMGWDIFFVICAILALNVVWVMPWVSNIVGLTYRAIFGVKANQ